MRAGVPGLATAALVILAPAIAPAQQPTGPGFEVASVKRNLSGSQASNNGRVTGDRFTATNATVVQLLRAAYSVQEFQIEGEPGWSGSERFDITATIPAGQRGDEWRQMLQTLLAERFRLTLRREQRESTVLALFVAPSGLKIAPAGEARCRPPNASCGMSAAPTQIVARGQSMDQLATRLARSIGQPVLNRTAISGIFDFTLQWEQEDQFREPGASASPAIFTALSEQLGLRLQRERAPVDVLVVERVERPTPD
jgi:uncharacterized protein (TIGR03435 family)